MGMIRYDPAMKKKENAARFVQKAKGLYFCGRYMRAETCLPTRQAIALQK